MWIEVKETTLGEIAKRDKADTTEYIGQDTFAGQRFWFYDISLFRNTW